MLKIRNHIVSKIGIELEVVFPGPAGQKVVAEPTVERISSFAP